MTSTGARLVAWARRHAALIVATLVVIGTVAFALVGILRIGDERQARLNNIEDLVAENKRQSREHCETINDSNTTLRGLLDGAIRARPPGAPLTNDARRLTIDTYRRLPFTDCATGAKTYFDPPLPS